MDRRTGERLLLAVLTGLALLFVAVLCWYGWGHVYNAEVNASLWLGGVYDG